MNREQQLQKEIENHKKVIKFAIATVLFLIAVVIAIVSIFGIYVSKDEPKPTQRQIMPFQRDYEPEWYLYKDGTKGTLSHHPITHEKGILIQSDTL